MQDNALFHVRSGFGDQQVVDYFGPDIEPEDRPRLTGQLALVLETMSDERWRTLEDLQAEIAERHGRTFPTQSLGARVRDLRQPKFGSHHVDRRRIGAGLFEYRLRKDETQRAAT